ncbi:hypothetical protein G7Y89_g6946 [Cudoniella acicularis]|uniref:Uncharacterized protein n=1 Tax=Cudoniella acicularis TaxID=354080 RepID=A0A8H4RJI8_9HELO|nr:hypothetical protein G7Y89_g6946 [Cudoniella acicularis]
MRFNIFVSAFLASAALVAAIPTASNIEDSSLEKRGCPHGWQICGVCDGTKCKIAGSFLESCGVGSCTRQAGAGDGSICGHKIGGQYYCPGNGGLTGLPPK